MYYYIKLNILNLVIKNGIYSMNGIIIYCPCFDDTFHMIGAGVMAPNLGHHFHSFSVTFVD